MSHIISLLALILIALCVTQSPAQYDNVDFRDLESYQGFTDSAVRAVTQDKNGFMWFGTQYGLYKYDGYKFTPYFHDPEDPNSLSSNWVMCLQVDSSGSMWIGTMSGGVNRFDPMTEKFTRFLHDDTNKNSLCDNNILCLKNEDVPGGDMWIGTQKGLSRLHVSMLESDSMQFTFTNFRNDPKNDKSLSFNYIWSIYKDNNNRIWVGTQDGCLNSYNEKNNNFKRIYRPIDPIRRFGKSDNYVKDIDIFYIGQYPDDPMNSLTIGATEGIYKYNITDNSFSSYCNKIDSISKIINLSHGLILQERSGSLWFGQPSNIFILNKEKNKLSHYRWSKSSRHQLSWGTIGQLFEDRQGIIWAGLWGGTKIRKYDKATQLFKRYELESGTGYYNVNVLTADLIDKDRFVWIGSPRHGLLKYDRLHHKYKQYKERPRKQVVSICQIQSNPDILWLGTLGAGLYRFHKKSGNLEQFFYRVREPANTPEEGEKFIESNAYILSILNDDNNKLWLGSLRGLFHFNPQLNHYKSYLNNPKDSTSISSDLVSCLIRSRNKTESVIWVGTRNGGLNKFYPETGKFIRYRANPNDTTGLSSDYISSVFEDKSGILWVGTTLGLHRFNEKNNTFSHIIDSEKKLNAEILSIQEDDKGFLWLNSSSGLHRFNPDSYELRTYGGRFSRWAYNQSPNGELLYGFGNSFWTIYPTDLKANNYTPPVVLTDFQIFNNSVQIGEKNTSPLQKSITETKEIILSYDQSMISLEFAALDYSKPLRNKYAYMMEGVDTDWVMTDASRRFATYTNLDPGEYTFLVKGCNSHGVWNETPISIKVIITPPWWKTSWAYMVYILLLISFIFAIRSYDLKRQRLRQALELEHEHAEKLAQVDQLKSKFFANISHEFRTPLTLIEGPVRQLINGSFKGNIKTQYRLILRNTRRLLKMINQILDLSKIDAGHMDLKTSRLNLIPLVKGLVMTFSSKADQKSIAIDFEIAEKEIYLFLDKEKFETIITNLMSNALKFTPENGEIRVAVKQYPPKHPLNRGNESLSTLEKGDNGGFRNPNTQFQIPNSEFVEITISNSGPGIPPERFDKIFDRFAHFDETKHSDYESSGIGLSLTK